ncbi:MAG: hypothetical protein AB1597_00965 [Chloroflexota bacterium]
MATWEDKLPPIMREKLAGIGDLTPEEKARMKAAEQLSGILAAFYKGDIDADGLWQKLKPLKDEGKGSLLKEAQLQLIDSLTLNSTGLELQKRKSGIVAIETLKSQATTSALEQMLGTIDALQGRYKKELQQGYDYLKAEVERDPRARVRQVKQGQQTVVVQLTVDEAVKSSQEWQNFVAEHEKRFSQEFSRIIDRLKKQVK